MTNRIATGRRRALDAGVPQQTVADMYGISQQRVSQLSRQARAGWQEKSRVRGRSIAPTVRSRAQ